MVNHKDVLIGWRTLITLYLLIGVLAISTAFIYVTNNGIHNDSEYDDLKKYVSTHTHNDTEYSDLENIVNLNKIKTLAKNLTINEPAEAYYTHIISVQYAGYISVNIESSTTDKNYVEVVYTSHNIYYENKIIIIGYKGIAMFPLLPSNDIQVRIGNTNKSESVTQTYSITYFY